MAPGTMLVIGFCWLIIGIFIGFFIAMDRLVKSPELEAKLEDLREIRYEADRARTLHHVAKMMERVNRNLLLEIIEQFDKDVKEHLKGMKNEQQN